MPPKLVGSFTPGRLSPVASSHLNLARTIAALAVTGEHVRNLFWVDYNKVHNPNLATGVVYLLTGLGHQAVMVFFVLSGFLISSSLFRSAPKTWSLRSYAIDRLSRLYIVFLPALLLGAICDTITQRLAGAQIYFWQPIDHFGPSFGAGFTLKSFLGNLLFLQGTFVIPFGSNGPLWSLANEFWYYVFWALLAILLVRSTLPRRVVGVLLMASCLTFISSAIWLELPIWLMGASLHLCSGLRLASTRRYHTAWRASAFFLFALMLYLSKAKAMKIEGDYLVGGTFAILLHITIQRNDIQPPIYSQISKFFSNFSFSLYVTHFPILILIRTAMWKHPAFQPSLFSGSLLLVPFAIVLLSAYLFYLCTEAFTGKIRLYLHSRLLADKSEPDHPKLVHGATNIAITHP